MAKSAAKSGKPAYRRQLVVNQSGRCIAAYVYASNGVWESTTDVVFGGHGMIAENGSILVESRRFDNDVSIHDARAPVGDRGYGLLQIVRQARGKRVARFGPPRMDADLSEVE